MLASRLLAFVLLALPAAGAEEPAQQIRHLASLGRADGPAPSPDGARLAYLTTMFGGRPQAAVMALDGSFPQQLTDEPGGVLGLRYSPSDGHLIVAQVRRQERQRLILVDDQVAAPTEVDSTPGDQLLGGFTRDGRKLLYANLESGKVTLRLLALDTRKAVDIAPPPNPALPPPGATPPAALIPLAESTQGLVALGPISSDGRSALFQVRRGSAIKEGAPAADEFIYLLDLATARAELITPHDKPARFRSPHFSPDGRTVYLLTDAGRATLGVEAVTLATKIRRVILAGPRPVEAYALSEDGHRLAAASEAEGETILSQLELPSLRPQPMPLPPGGALELMQDCESIVWTRSGDRLLFAWRLAADTTDLWGIKLGFGTPTRLTRSAHPGIALDQLPRPEQVKVPGQGGELQGWLWRPAQIERPRAAILLQTLARPVLDARIQTLVALGFAVLSVGVKAEASDLQSARSFVETRGDLDAHSPLLISETKLGEKPKGAALFEWHGRPIDATSLAELQLIAADELKK